MTTLKGPAKNAAATLNVSPERPGRFFAALSWDAKELPAAADGFFHTFRNFLALNRWKKDDDKEGRDTDSDFYDLDLCCYIFDAAYTLLHVVEPSSDRLLDPSGKVFHSEDDQVGMGGNDDEIISVLTRDGLPAEYCNFLFVVKSDSKFNIGEIPGARVRLADGKTNESALENTVDAPAALKASAYVFCHVFRDAEGWTVRNIDEYADFDAAWETLLPALARGKAA